MRIRRGLCLGRSCAATEHARRARRGPAPGHDSLGVEALGLREPRLPQAAWCGVIWVLC